MGRYFHRSAAAVVVVDDDDRMPRKSKREEKGARKTRMRTRPSLRNHFNLQPLMFPTKYKSKYLCLHDFISVPASYKEDVTILHTDDK